MKKLFIAIIFILIFCIPVQAEELNTSQEIAAFLSTRDGKYNNIFHDGYAYERRESEVALFLYENNLAIYLGITEFWGKTEFHAIDLGLDAVLDSFSYHYNGINMEGYEDYDEMRESLPGTILILIRREDSRV